MSKDTKCLMTGVLIILSACAGLIIVGLGVQAAACHTLGQMTARSTHWEFWNGCFVQVKGQWVPQSTWRKWE
jgi:hypothetical protein